MKASPAGNAAPRRHRLAVLNSHPIQYFAPLYRALAESPDIDITVYYCSRQGTQKGYVDRGFGREVVWDVPLLEGYRHKFLPNWRGEHGVKGFSSLVNPGIIGEIWRERYDAIVIHGHSHLTNLLAVAAALVVGTRILMRGDTQLMLQRRPIKRLIRGPVMNAFYRCFDGFLYIGSRNREFYAAHGVPSRKLHFVPFSVDNEFFAKGLETRQAARAALRGELQLRADVPIVLFASKMTPAKRAIDALKAIELVNAKGLDCALVMVGDGSQRPELEEFVASHGLANVRFLGFQNQDALVRIFAACDIFTLPSENEPWGLVINEVMSAGLPVVASDEVGAAKDLVIDGQTGFTFGKGDIEEFASCLCRLVADGELRERMGGQARALIDAWSLQASAEGIRKALDALLSIDDQLKDE